MTAASRSGLNVDSTATAASMAHQSYGSPSVNIVEPGDVPKSPAGGALAAALTNDTNPVRLASMIDLRDVLRLSLLCKAMRESFGRPARKACLTKGAGVPEDRRIEFWMCMLNVEKVRTNGVVVLQ